MRTPIFYEIYSVSDSDRTVQQVIYTFEQAIRQAFSTFFSDARVKSVDADALGGGTFTFRMYGRVPIIAFTEEDDETVYFSGDRGALQRLVDADVEKIDDLLEKPRDAIGGWRRKRTKRTRKSKRTKRARRTLRKKLKT